MWEGVCVSVHVFTRDVSHHPLPSPPLTLHICHTVQQAWRLLALGWPTVKTLHTLLALVPSATTPARRQHLMGEW